MLFPFSQARSALPFSFDFSALFAFTIELSAPLFYLITESGSVTATRQAGTIVIKV
jgi:hypothetical protein